MKKWLYTVLLLSLFSSAVEADPFVGFKVTPLNTGNSTNGPENISVNIGYALDSWLADLSLVTEFSRSVSMGKTIQGDELSLNADSMYVLWKTTRSMYVSARLGMVHKEWVIAGNSDNSFDLYSGVSIGQVIGRTRLQIEYVSLGSDVNYFGIGLEFDF